MSETHAIIRLVGSTKTGLERALFFLDSESRPSFEEEVPATEKAVFEALEFAPAPAFIRAVGNTAIEAGFENEALADLKDMIIGLSALKFDQCYVFFGDDEEYKVYFKLDGQKLVCIYTLEDDEALDTKLWELEWDERALSLIIEWFGV
jgi:hypothetical protein